VHRDQKLEMLRKVPLFAGCPNRDLHEIESLADEVEVPAGKVLMRQGDTAQEFFAIVEGHLQVDRDGKSVARLGPGDFVGEIGLVDGGPRTATVTADSPARLLVMGRREFHSLLDGHPGIRLEVLEALARRIRGLDGQAVH